MFHYQYAAFFAIIKLEMLNGDDMKFQPISVIIPTMNRPMALKKTLEGYISADCIPSQIIVVDQSEDKCVAEEIMSIVTSFASVTKVLYRYQEKPSSTAARNKAIAEASEEILIMSDDDIDVNFDTVQNVYEAMLDLSISMIAGIDDNSKHSKTNIGYLLGTKSFRNRKIGHVTASVLGRYPDTIVGRVNTQWAMGYFFVVRKSLIDRWCIKWDESLSGYAYAEDLDFSYSYYLRSKQELLKCILDDKIHVKHLVSLENRAPSRKTIFMYVINRLYLHYKHQMGVRSSIAMLWCDFWKIVYRIFKSQNPQDLWNAICYAYKNRIKIKQGILDYHDISK